VDALKIVPLDDKGRTNSFPAVKMKVRASAIWFVNFCHGLLALLDRNAQDHNDSSSSLA
jgi:hypothetical protein